ncbi:hypothetical protein N7456_004745 [Penicillium angulare]|uniref:Atg28p n=1 Tax=Penicillium angulare TaxID=116970 RepID=A0A9W9FX52_9EURO|nr:hypothetical protein N7456_004745 [Penicillium angulare]
MSTLLPLRDKRLPAVPAAASTYHHSPLLYIERQSQHIQRSLQTLIDAQSEGLLSGLAQPPSDDISVSSSTPTSSRASRSRSPSTTPVRQPRPKKISLKAARQGIFQSIYDLLKLREEEREILSSQSNERDNALHEVQGFTSRRSGLEEAISFINNDRGNQRAKQLKDEAHDLETDIHELETKLYEMKAKHRHLVSEIANIENSVDAKLSSYTESLTLLQSDIRNYLRDPPVQPLSKRTNESSLYSLNPKRRTLEMAQDYWQQEQEDLHQRQQEVDAEILALEEGGGVWKQAMADVSGFEDRLRGYMRRYMQLSVQETDGAPVGSGKEDIAASVSQDLEQTIQQLGSHLELAEEKDWKLLVCCVAAELEALQEARGKLLPAFGLPVSNELSTSSVPQSGLEETTDKQAEAHTDALQNDDPEPPADLLKDGDEHQPDAASRSEDDEPDPAWLLEA